MKMLQQLQIASGFVPVNLATAANDGDWINMSLVQRLLIVFFKAVGTAGEDPTLTIEQATSSAGAGAKALNIEEIYVKQGADLFTIAEFTKVAISPAANTYTELTSAEAQAIWAVEIRAPMLDVNNAFDWVRGRVADVGAAAQIGALLYIGDGLRYQAEIPPGIIS